MPREACITAYQLPTAQIAALEVHGGWRVEQGTPERGRCEFMLVSARSSSSTVALQRPGWTLIARERRPTERDEQTLVYRRDRGAAG